MATNEDANEEELGGAQMHSTISGVSDFLAKDEKHALEITKDLINQFSGWRMEYKRWQFFQTLGNRDLNKSMILGLSLMNQGNSMISLMYPLSAFFQELLFIKNNSGTISTNNSYIPLPPSVIRQLPQIANRFNKEEIEYALAILGKIDKRLKTTSISDEALFTHFLFSVLQANG